MSPSSTFFIALAWVLFGVGSTAPGPSRDPPGPSRDPSLSGLRRHPGGGHPRGGRRAGGDGDDHPAGAVGGRASSAKCERSCAVRGAVRGVVRGSAGLGCCAGAGASESAGS